MSLTYLEDAKDTVPGHRETATARAGGGLYAAGGKRLLDVSIVVLSSPIVVPLVFAAWVLILLGGGRGIYGQPRVGRGGRVFRCWKLRTMVIDADGELERLLAENPSARREWNENQKLSDDPRITWWGRLLRMTSLDELPQFWNVLVGEMSLIGPRPFTPEQKALYDAKGGQAYYVLRPGVSGLWQVECRHNAEFCRRVEYDRQYLQTMSLLGDLRIIFRTLLVVLHGTGR